MGERAVAPTTAFDSLIDALARSAAFNKDDTVPPAAVLWPDEKREWEKLVPRAPRGTCLSSSPSARTTRPHRAGPAIWLRCVLAGKIAGVTLPTGTVPIIYLPGVSRSTLRATEDCPHELKPLAELQYRGVIWSQANAKDWTVAAYLQTEKGGLNLTVARDQATATSLRRAVEKLADVPLADLQAKSAAGELNGTYFDSLVSDDLVDDLLSWMSQPEGDAEPVGAGPVGNAVQPVHRRLRLRPRPRRRARRGREAGDAAEGGLEDGLEALRRRPGPLPRPGGTC